MADLLQKHLRGTTRSAVETALEIGELGINEAATQLELIIEKIAGSAFLHFSSDERLALFTASNAGAIEIGVEDDSFTSITGDTDLQTCIKSIDTALGALPALADVILKDGSVDFTGSETFPDNIKALFGNSGAEGEVYSNGTALYIKNVNTGISGEAIIIETSGTNADISIKAGTENGIRISPSSPGTDKIYLYKDVDASGNIDINTDGKMLLLSDEGQIYSDGTDLYIKNVNTGVTSGIIIETDSDNADILMRPNGENGIRVSPVNGSDIINLYKDVVASGYIDIATDGEKLKLSDEGEIYSDGAILHIDNVNASATADIVLSTAHASSEIILSPNGTPMLTVTASGVGVNVSVPAQMLDVRDGYIALSDADVSGAGTTSNVYATLRPLSGTAGGFYVIAQSDTDATGMFLAAEMGSTNPTDTTAAMIFSSSKWDGAGTGGQLLADAETAYQFKNYTANLISILGNGDMRIETDGKLLLRDSAIGIYSQADTFLDLFADGAVRIGDSAAGAPTNYSKFEPDGTIVSIGNATTWEDINIDLSPLQSGGSKPGFATPGTSSIRLLSFAVGEDVDGTAEIKHAYKLGSDITPHIHWVNIGAPTGTDQVKFQLDYWIVDEAGIVGADTTTDTGDIAVDTDDERVSANFPTISNAALGGQIAFKVSRIAAAGDAYAGECGVLTFGFHVEQDMTGSRQITTK